MATARRRRRRKRPTPGVVRRGGGDAVLRLIIEGSEISSRELFEAVFLVESVAHRVAVDDLQRAADEFAEISPSVDIAIERAAALRGQYVRFDGASRGSIVLVGVVSAAGAWLLSSTVGEAFKEGWKKSALHAKLAAWIQKQLDSFPRRFSSAVEPVARELRLPATSSTRNGTISVRLPVQQTPDGIAIEFAEEEARHESKTAPEDAQWTAPANPGMPLPLKQK
jgi:hypothetical protein